MRLAIAPRRWSPSTTCASSGQWAGLLPSRTLPRLLGGHDMPGHWWHWRQPCTTCICVCIGRRCTCPPLFMIPHVIFTGAAGGVASECSQAIKESLQHMRFIVTLGWSAISSDTPSAACMRTIRPPISCFGKADFKRSIDASGYKADAHTYTALQGRCGERFIAEVFVCTDIGVHAHPGTPRLLVGPEGSDPLEHVVSLSAAPSRQRLAQSHTTVRCTLKPSSRTTT